MSVATNVVKRPGSSVFYARVEVPVDVQPLLKKAQLWKSLRTRDPREARARALPVLSAWQAEFDDLRRRRNPTPDDLQAGIWQHYEDQLEADQRERASLPTEHDLTTAENQLAADVDNGRVAWTDDPVVQLNATLDLRAQAGTADFLKSSRTHRMELLKKHIAVGETALIQWAADDLIQRERLIVDRGSPAYRDLCHKLQRAELEYLQRAAERDVGTWSGVPSDPVVVPPDATMGRKRAVSGETIMELYDRFQAEKGGSASRDTWANNRKYVKLLAEFIGETSHITAITKKAVRDWKHKLASWPLKAADTNAFKNLSFRKVIEANITVGKPTISQKTINKYLSAVGSFAEWLLQNEYIDADVMRGMYLTIDKNKKTRFPFTPDQLKKIFASPLFSTCMGDKQEHLPGNVSVRDWRYWIPWIGLYSGARLGEMAQLLAADIKQLHGAWVMHITEEGAGLKSTKTAGSMRVVPIHSKLIELGFLKYHADVVARGSQNLFPEIEPDARGYMSGNPSAFFNDYFRDIGVKVDKTVNFHSLRHGIADAFRNAGYMDEQFNMLLGHTKATTTGRYGILPEGILSERVKMIEAVSFVLR